MDIKFTCSSFLPPKNLGWKNLEENHTLHFGEFGDWPIVIPQKPNEDVIVLVLVLEDIISDELIFSSSDEDFCKGKVIIDKLISSLNNRLSSNQFVLISWISDNSDSIIRNSRNLPFLTKLEIYFESKLYSLVDSFDRLFLIPLRILFSKHGYSNCFDSRNFFMARIRFSQLGVKLLSESISSVLVRIKNPASKVLILDCDNTLWGGVIGEAGLSNILIEQDGIGKAFSSFQKVIKQFSKNGLVLAVSSKNEEKDVLDVFENHSSMILKKDDIITFKVNWREKFINIIEISDELGLGLDSFVFWDDNPIEREKVKKNLPMVKVINPPVEVVEWTNTIKSLDCLASFNKTNDDLKKVSQYKAKAKFETHKKISLNNTDFLKSINMKASIIAIDKSNISRASQLCQKTNQMNLRLIRHDEKSIGDIIKNKRSIVFLISLEDDFGNHGIVSLVIVKPDKEKSVAFLDTFLMSCRVLGRDLENFIFSTIKQKMIKNGFKKLNAEYIKGDRNTPAKKILHEMGLLINSKYENNVNYFIEVENWQINDNKLINS